MSKVYIEIPAFMKLVDKGEETGVSERSGKPYTYTKLQVTCPKGWHIGDMDISGATFIVKDWDIAKNNPRNKNTLIVLPSEYTDAKTHEVKPYTISLRVYQRDDEGNFAQDAEGNRLFQDISVTPAQLRAAWKEEQKAWMESHPRNQRQEQQAAAVQEPQEQEPLPTASVYDHDIDF